MKNIFLLCLMSGLSAAAFAQTNACARLATLKLTNATITSAHIVEAGAFATPGATAQRNAPDFKDLPAFCRVAATLTPSSDSDIKIEVWLPVANWNNKLMAVGNGGWSGAISYPALARELARGYATTSTDTGHTGPSASFALGHPEKLVDFAWRAVHEMTVQAKAIIAAHYGRAPKYSYWNGCSSGGRQGLKAAQRFPGDFDGIIAGAPVNNFIRQRAGIISVAQAVSSGDAYISPTKYKMIHAAVMQACDKLDGVADGVLENPKVCQFDPRALQCKGEDAADCLTAAQVASARRIYAATKNPKTGEVIFPGLMPGTELDWDTPASKEGARATATDYFKYVLFKNPQWDWRSFDLARDTAAAEQLDQGLLAAMNADLTPYFKRGGKLLLYHGWADPNVAPENTINYYQNVLRAAGKAKDAARLFLVPGMGHCGGGDCPNVFDAVAALEQWVERGQAPQRIIAARMKNGIADRTRPLCPYPQSAKYKGSGSTDEAANFVCQ
jgi:feruloyl esterase